MSESGFSKVRNGTRPETKVWFDEMSEHVRKHYYHLKFRINTASFTKALLLLSQK